MKYRFKKISAIILALLLAFTGMISAYALTIYEYYGYEYTILSNSTVSLYGWDDSSPALVIPKTLNNRNVVEIANRAFMNDTEITSVNFYEAVYLRRIGSFAFKGCTGLTRLALPEYITSIDSAAFQECASLNSVIINAQISALPAQCFYKCTSLTSVTLNDTITEIGHYAFADCPSLSYLEIPASVTSIGSTAFMNDSITLGVYTDSYAHEFAVSNNIPFVLLDAPEPTEPPTEAPATEAPVTEAPVTEAPATEAPVTEAPATEKPQGYFLGDVDGNGTVEMIDATTIQRFLALMKIPETSVVGHADVDGDGEVTIIDVSALRRHFAQFEQLYPIGEWVEQS